MWFVDLLLVVPAFLIIAIVSPSFRGKTWLVFVILLAAFLWMITARMVRGMTVSLRDREFVLAARYMGVSGPRIIVRHILPSMSSLLIIDATINVGAAIIGETGLSYFGFGVQPPDVSLGTVIADGTTAAVSYPWLFAFPAGAARADHPRRQPHRRRPARRARPDLAGVRMSDPVLRVEDLHVTFPGGEADVRAVRGVELRAAARGDPGHRRRVRLGQVGGRRGRHGAAPVLGRA